MANYEKAKINLANTQPSKLKFADWSNTKNNKKNFQDEELPHESFLTMRQKLKIGNAFAKNISTDIRLSTA